MWVFSFICVVGFKIDDWNKIFLSKNRDDSQLQPTLNVILDRWSELPDEDRDSSRTQFSNYCKLYGYLSIIHQFDNTELEKHYIFFEYLRNKFPVDGRGRLDVSNRVDLESLTVTIREKENILLDSKNAIFPPNSYGEGSVKEEVELAPLSEIIDDINKSYEALKGKEEDTRKFIFDMATDERFKNVLNSDNTDSNKRDERTEVYNDKNMEILDTNKKLHDLLAQNDRKEKTIQVLISRPDLLNQLRG